MGLDERHVDDQSPGRTAGSVDFILKIRDAPFGCVSLPMILIEYTNKNQ